MMKDSVYDLSLDIQGRGMQLALPVKRGDSARCFRIRLTQTGQAYEIPGNCTAVFTARKPDDTVIYNGCALERSVAVYSLTGQETNVAGVVVCELRLYDGEGKLLTSPSFCLMVEDTVYSDEAVMDSSSEFTALTGLVSQTMQMMEEYRKSKPLTLIARAPLGLEYTATAEGTELVEGMEILLIPQNTNQGAATLSINGGEAYPLCLRPGWNVTGNDLRPQLTLPVEAGMLLRGAEYVFRFDGTAWILQSYMAQQAGKSNNFYVQAEEPENAPEGAGWIDTDEEVSLPESTDAVTRSEMEAYVDQRLAAIGIAEEGAY